MDHIAIMKKSWKLIDKIVSREKTIETRWYMAKFAPWNRINKGDTVYFKDSCEKVTALAVVDKVVQFEKYDETILNEIIKKYGGKGFINFVNTPSQTFHDLKHKKYAILIFLSNSKNIEPFQINKQGYGNACAWICVDDIEKIKI